MNDNNSTTAKAERLSDSKTLEFQWKSINWNEAETYVNRLQVRIAQATREKKWNTVKRLQYLLTHSYYVKVLAVRKITTNKGKTLRVWISNYGLPLHLKCEEGYPLQTKTTKQNHYGVFISKRKARKQNAPFGIPCMYNRAMQALYALALDPVAEVTADTKSFGFRKGRSCHDAFEYIFTALSRKMCAEWVLEGDIKGCFDHISHEWLIENIPIDKSV